MKSQSKSGSLARPQGSLGKALPSIHFGFSCFRFLARQEGYCLAFFLQLSAESMRGQISRCQECTKPTCLKLTVCNFATLVQSSALVNWLPAGKIPNRSLNPKLRAREVEMGLLERLGASEAPAHRRATPFYSPSRACVLCQLQEERFGV